MHKLEYFCHIMRKTDRHCHLLHNIYDPELNYKLRNI